MREESEVAAKARRAKPGPTQVQHWVSERSFRSVFMGFVAVLHFEIDSHGEHKGQEGAVTQVRACTEGFPGIREETMPKADKRGGADCNRLMCSEIRI